MMSRKTSRKGGKATKNRSGSKKNAPIKPQRAAKRKKAAATALTVGQKAQLLKPIKQYDDLVDRLVTTWRNYGAVVRVPGLTPARLGSALKTARRANAREDALRTAQQQKLQPLADARLLAEHAVWKSALDLYAMVKSAARTNPAIAEPFEFFANALARKRNAPLPDAPDAVATPPA